MLALGQAANLRTLSKTVAAKSSVLFRIHLRTYAAPAESKGSGSHKSKSGSSSQTLPWQSNKNIFAKRPEKSSMEDLRSNLTAQFKPRTGPHTPEMPVQEEMVTRTPVQLASEIMKHKRGGAEYKNYDTVPFATQQRFDDAIEPSMNIKYHGPQIFNTDTEDRDLKQHLEYIFKGKVDRIQAGSRSAVPISSPEEEGAEDDPDDLDPAGLQWLLEEDEYPGKPHDIDPSAVQVENDTADYELEEQLEMLENAEIQDNDGFYEPHDAESRAKLFADMLREQGMLHQPLKSGISVQQQMLDLLNESTQTFQADLKRRMEEYNTAVKAARERGDDPEQIPHPMEEADITRSEDIEFTDGATLRSVGKKEEEQLHDFSAESNIQYAGVSRQHEPDDVEDDPIRQAPSGKSTYIPYRIIDPDLVQEEETGDIAPPPEGAAGLGAEILEKTAYLNAEELATVFEQANYYVQRSTELAREYAIDQRTLDKMPVAYNIEKEPAWATRHFIKQGSIEPLTMEEAMTAPDPEDIIGFGDHVEWMEDGDFLDPVDRAGLPTSESEEAEEGLDFMAENSVHSNAALLQGSIDLFDRLVLHKKRKLMKEAKENRKFLIWRAQRFDLRMKNNLAKAKRAESRRKTKHAVETANKADPNMIFYPDLGMWFSKEELTHPMIRNAISGAYSNHTWSIPKRKQFIAGVVKDIKKFDQPRTPDELEILQAITDFPVAEPPPDTRHVRHILKLPIQDWNEVISAAEQFLDPSIKNKKWAPGPMEGRARKAKPARNI